MYTTRAIKVAIRSCGRLPRIGGLMNTRSFDIPLLSLFCHCGANMFKFNRSVPSE